MTDRIVLHGIELYAYGGVTADEQHVGQRYRIHIDLLLDLRAAGESDALSDTVSYAEVYDVVAETVRENRFTLLESAASRIAVRLLDTFEVQGVRVRLQKLLPPIDGVIEYAGVDITRDRGETTSS